jgi:hypothetical protein
VWCSSSREDDVREKISFKYGGMTYTYGTGDDDLGLLNAGRTEASCNLDVFCNVYPCVCAEGSKRKRAALNNWFEVLECNDGVNIFDPQYDPPTLGDAFLNNTVNGDDTLTGNYLNGIWK